MKFLTLTVLCFLVSNGAHAQNTKCMPKVLQFVLEEYEKQKAAGLSAHASYPKGWVFLGSQLSEEHVAITDISKNSYKVTIPLNYVNSVSSNLVLRTTLSQIDYETCTFDSLQKISFDVYEDIWE